MLKELHGTLLQENKLLYIKPTHHYNCSTNNLVRKSKIIHILTRSPTKRVLNDAASKSRFSASQVWMFNWSAKIYHEYIILHIDKPCVTFFLQLFACVISIGSHTVYIWQWHLLMPFKRIKDKKYFAITLTYHPALGIPDHKNISLA